MRRGNLYISMSTRPNVRSRFVSTSVSVEVARGNIFPMRNNFTISKKQVYDNLTRIGKVEMEEKLPILGSGARLSTGTSLSFFSNKKWLTEEEIQSGASFDCMNGVGFHIPGMFDKVLDIHKCWLQDDISNKIRLCVKEYCLSHEGYPFFDLRNQEGFVRTLMIRTASTGDLMGRIGFLP